METTDLSKAERIDNAVKAAESVQVHHRDCIHIEEDVGSYAKITDLKQQKKLKEVLNISQ